MPECNSSAGRKGGDRPCASHSWGEEKSMADPPGYAELHFYGKRYSATGKGAPLQKEGWAYTSPAEKRVM